MHEKLINLVLVSELLSTIPVVESLTYNINSSEDKKEITLFEHSREINKINTLTVVRGNEWSTTRRAVKNAYINEFNRVLTYINPFVNNIIIETNHYLPELSKNNIKFRNIKEDFKYLPIKKFSKKLKKIMRNAVESSGKPINPLGPRVLNEEYWEKVINDFFLQILYKQPNSGCIITRSFLTVMTEWIRFRDLFDGNTRKMIKVELGFPFAIEPFLRNSELCIKKVFESIDFLNYQRELSNWDFYKIAVRHLNSLRDNFQIIEDSFPIDFLFIENTKNKTFEVNAIGIDLPAPQNGYPIELTDGTIAKLPYYPWAMGYSL